MPYEQLEQTLVPNTTMQRWINSNGTFKQYCITPNEGYCVHAKGLDCYLDYDENGEPIGDLVLGYSGGTITAGYNYDFRQTTTIDGYTAYGVNEIFARPISEVPLY